MDEARKEHERALSRERNRRYREANKEKIKERHRKWREENEEHVDQYKKKYYEENKAEILQQHKEYREAHVEETREMKKRWYSENKEHTKEKVRRWVMSNPISVIANKQNHRARKIGFSEGISSEELSEVLSRFDNCCALTGDPSNVTIDHVIPLSFGVVGNVMENIIPLRFDLNSSKSSRNIFTWFESAKGRYGLCQTKFDSLITYLAEVNGMTTEEFRLYYHKIYDENAAK